MNKHVPCSWDNTYLLGWYDSGGRPMLTTWAGDLPIYNYVVTGCTNISIPMWDAKVPTRAQVYMVPPDRDPKEYANELGGYRAIGWNISVERKE